MKLFDNINYNSLNKDKQEFINNFTINIYFINAIN